VKKTIIPFFVVGLILWGQISFGQPPPEIVVLFTHDLHSYFLPHRTEGSGGIRWRGGYAQIATLIKNYRAQHGENVLLVDAGDFSMGTLFHTLYKSKAAELMLMSEMGYDALTLGNHDFDFHPDGLAEALKVVKDCVPYPPTIVASNMSFGPPHKRDQKLREMVESYPIKKYVVIKKGGVKIGLFGLMGKDARDDAPFARPVKFTDPVEAAREMVKVLKEKEQVDLIICLSHSGTSPDKSHSEDEQLARKVPEIDVIVSGHTHTLLAQPLVLGRTVIASAGRYGEYLGVMKLSVGEAPGHRLKAYHLIPITEEIPADHRIAKMIGRFKQSIQENFLSAYGLKYDGIVGEINYHTETLNQAYARRGETGLGNLITDAFRYAIKKAEGEKYVHVHLVIQPLGMIRSSFFQGNISTDDVFRVLSLGLGPDGLPGYPLLTTYLSGREIKRLMEIETTVSRFKRDAHLQMAGARLSYNPYRPPFDRVVSIKLEEPDGNYRDVIPDRLYRVGMNYYSAQMVEYINRVSHGLLAMTPKDRRGNVIKKVEDGIVQMNTPYGQTELKEWVALTMFLKSCPDTNGNGIPDVPLRYRNPEGRITIHASFHPVEFFRGATFITWGILVALLIAMLVLGGAIWFIGKKIRFHFKGENRNEI